MVKLLKFGIHFTGWWFTGWWTHFLCSAFHIHSLVNIYSGLFPGSCSLFSSVLLCSFFLMAATSTFSEYKKVINPDTSLTPQHIVALSRSPSVTVFKEVPLSSLSCSLSTHDSARFIAQHKQDNQYSEAQLFKVLDRLIAQNSNQEVLRRVHNLKSKAMQPMFTDMMSFLEDSLSIKRYMAVNRCNNFVQFSETMNQLAVRSKQVWDEVNEALSKYCAKLGIADRFWSQAADLDALNAERNTQEHESIGDSVNFIQTFFKQPPAAQHQWQGVKVMLTALAGYATANMDWLVALDQQRQDSQRKALNAFNKLNL